MKVASGLIMVVCYFNSIKVRLKLDTLKGLKLVP